MTNLKTLKEIYFPSDGCCCEDNIRQEAIKWIKKIDDFSMQVKDHKIEIDEGVETIYFDLNGLKKEWIKHFFNITEDDLK